MILHIRYTCREAGHLKTAATDLIKDEVLQGDSGDLLQLFSIGNEFAGAWQLFKSAPNDLTRKFTVAIDKNNFPYWTRQPGLDDSLTASFCSIDLKKNKLTVATQNLELEGDAESGWNLTVDSTKNAVFSFLKSALAQKRNVYLIVAYKSA